MYTTPRCNKCDKDLTHDIQVFDGGKVYCESCNLKVVV